MKITDLWVEKYRPQTLDDICLKEDIKERILAWGDKIPHILLVGNVGIGKTSIAKILVTDILKCDYLYINASDENGVETVRNKITGFVQTKSLDGNLKVVVLDEADQFSFEAQSILRNMMETYAGTARFILTGNYKYKIGVPLQSRCQSVELEFSMKDFIKRIFTILKSENITPDKNTASKIVEYCKRYYPDFRSVINFLQLSWVNGEFKFIESVNTSEFIEQIWNNIQFKKSLQTRKFLIENETKFQSDWNRLLKDLLNYVYELDLDETYKRMVILTIADHLEKSTRVLDKEINFLSCILSIESN